MRRVTSEEGGGASPAADEDVPHDHDREQDHQHRGDGAAERGRAPSRAGRLCDMALPQAASTACCAFLARTARAFGAGAPAADIMPQAPSSAPSRAQARAAGRARTSRAASARRFFGREAEAGVVGRIAEQDHRAMATRLRRRERVVHQRRPDAELAGGRFDRERAEHERRAPPALTCHSRTVPTSRPWRTAEKARPSAGARPSRRRWQVRIWRFSPKQASSSASRAATSEARSARIANGAAFGVRARWSSEAVMARQSPLQRREAPRKRCQ